MGIVAEYNPFHQGHRFLIEESRRTLGVDICVSVMSGPFSQRGYPCLYDKWTRAEAAVRGGVDLVVELPVIFATGNAEVFARGAVAVLEGFGGIDYLVFGSECGDIDRLRRTKQFLSDHDDEINQMAATLQRKGESFPKAREHACTLIDPAFDSSLLREPNNILALSYMKWIDKMEPFTIKRAGEGYHETGSALREQVFQREPNRLRRMETAYFDLIRLCLLRMSEEELSRIAGAEGGLGNKLRKELIHAADLEDLIERTKSKVYTRTRVTRLLNHVLLGITEELTQTAVPYIRILGFNRRGASFLKSCIQREQVSLPVLTNPKKAKEKDPTLLPWIEKDILATQLYALLTEQDLYRNHDFVHSPIIVEEEPTK